MQQLKIEKYDKPLETHTKILKMQKRNIYKTYVCIKLYYNLKRNFKII